MRKVCILALIVLLLAGCATPQPGAPAPPASGAADAAPAGDEAAAPASGEDTAPAAGSDEAAPAEPATAVEGPAAGDLAAKLAGLDIDQFFEVSFRELLLRTPEQVVEAGLVDEYGLEGAELNNVSDDYVRETYQMVSATLDMLREYDREALTPEQQVSYDVYEWYLDDLLRQQEFMYYDYPSTFMLNAIHVQTLDFFTEIHPITDRQDAEDYITRLSLLSTKFEQIIDDLKVREEAGIVPPRFTIQWTLYGLRNLASSPARSTPYYTTLEEKFAPLSSITPEEQQALLDEAEAVINESVLPAYRALIDYLAHQESIAPTDDGVWQFDGGDAYYAQAVRRHSTTEMSADEIHALGLRELERIHADMRVIFDELGYPADESLPELFERVANDGGFVSGGAVVETYEMLIEQASQNLDAVFDIRPNADVIVIGGPSGAYYTPGSLDGSRPGAFYANVSGGPEALYHMPSLAYHEAIPGHHWQIALAQEMDLPTFRNIVFFNGYAEGWALYAERLAWELGWYEDDPYGNLGRLQYEALRAARLVVDTGIHTKGWTFDQARTFMVENTGFGSDFVEGEVGRYIVWPGQATSYMIGMLKILELRQQAMDELGDQFDLTTFHHVVVGNGSMPLDVLERVVQDYIDATLNE